MDDLISREAAITAIQKAYADTEGGEDKLAVWKNVGLTNALHIMQDLPSAQPEKCTEERTETHGVCLDVIDRQATLDWLKNEWNGMVTSLFDGIKALPSAQPEITEAIVKEYCEKHCLAVVDARLFKEMKRRWSSAQPAPCEFCKHNNIADDKACLMCSAERRTDGN